MEIFSLVVGCFAIGLIAKSIEPKIVNISSYINKLIINVIFPIIILSIMPDLEFNTSLVFVALTPWIGFVVFIPCAIWVSRVLKLDDSERAVVILLSILGNTAFLGIGMARSFLGEESIASAILYDQLGSFMILSTLGTTIIAIYSNKGNKKGGSSKPSATTVIQKVISFPPFIALIISFFIPSTASFGSLLELFKLIGSTIVPLALIVIGLQIELKVEKRHRKPILAVICMKMLVLPTLTLVAAIAFGISNPQFNASVFQAAMPSMVTPAIMLIEARIAPKLAASILGIATLAGFITLPAWAYLLTNIL